MKQLRWPADEVLHGHRKRGEPGAMPDSGRSSRRHYELQLGFDGDDDTGDIPDDRPKRGSTVRRDTAMTDRSVGIVYVPTEPVDGGTHEAKLQLRRMRDDRLALLAYTSLNLLVAGCGANQAWLAAPVEQLEQLRPLVGFDVIALNVELPDDWRVDAAGHADTGTGEA